MVAGERDFSRMARRAFAGVVLAAGVFAAQTPAMAQVVGDSFTDSSTETVVFNPATVNITNITNYSTQIIGRLAGGAALFDQTFAAAFSDPLVQAGVTAARLAITTAGGPGVIIGVPVLTASATTTATVSTTTYSLAGTVSTPQTIVTFGPANIQIGQLTVCAGIGALPGPTRPTCGPGTPTPYAVGDDETNFNTFRNTTYTVDQNTQTTNTTTIFEQYTITGVVQALGRVHALAPSAIADQGDRFMRRLLNEGTDDGEGVVAPPSMPGVMSYAPMGAGQPFPAGVMAYAPQAGSPPSGVVSRPGFKGWLNGFGWHGQRSGSGGIPGDRRQAFGIEGGFAADVTNNLRLGFGMDYSQIRVSLRGAGESATINLTQAGLFAGWRNGPWYIASAATAGFADASTAIVTPGVPGGSTGSYDAKTYAVSGEAGYRFALNGWTLTPHTGVEWRRVSIGSFVETGGLALTSPGGDFDRSKVWAGLKANSRFALNNGMSLSLSAFTRIAGYSNGSDVLPVAFVVAPGVPLTVASPALGRVGAEAGFAAALAITPNAELFAGYDVRLRQKLVMHTGTAGLRVRW